MLRLEAHGDRQRVERALMVARPPQRRAEMVVGLEEIGIAFPRALEARDRVSGSTLEPMDEPEAIVRHREARVQADGFGVSPRGGLEVTPRFMLCSENVLAVRLCCRGALLGGNATGKRHHDSHGQGVPEHR